MTDTITNAIPTITANRHWNFWSVRAACINNDLYTHGTSKAWKSLELSTSRGITALSPA